MGREERGRARPREECEREGETKRRVNGGESESVFSLSSLSLYRNRSALTTMLDLAAGAFLRALFLATTLRTPGHGAVPTTDVDHAVAVRGAAAAVVAKSACGPYADPSFRYPPTVALLAAPALTLHPAAAKALYCLFDLGVAALAPPGAPRAAWALNPLAAALAARGSADAATAVLVLLALRGVRRARSTAETAGGKGQQQQQQQQQ